MKRPLSRDVDTAAKRIFASALPSDWEPREEVPDYGLDYTVEIFSERQSTGLRFAVQLKGTTAPRYRGGTIAFSINTNNLRDYVDKERWPVFLVGIDVPAKKGYWCFLQEYVLDNYINNRWRDQQSVSIRVPLSNTIDDSKKFAKAVELADKRMADLRPGAVGPAITAEQKRLESLDERIIIKLQASDHGRHYHFSARTPFEVKFEITGDSATVMRKASDLVDKGLPTNFEPGEIRFSGSRLFEEQLGDVETIHIARSFEVILYLIAVNQVGEEVARLDLPGSLTGGRSELRFTHVRENVPLDIDFTVIGWGLGEPILRCEGIKFVPPKWSGQSISHLAYFRQLKALIEAARHNIPWLLECYFQGGRIFHGTISVGNGFAEHAGEFVALMDKARKIIKPSKKNVLLPETFTIQHAEQVNELATLMQGKEMQLPKNPAPVRVTVTRNAIRQLLDEFGGAPDDDTLTVHCPSMDFSFLNDKIEIGPLALTITHVRITPSVEQLRSLLEETENNSLEVIFEPLKDSRASARLAV